jgi:peptidoglycan/xylan/chitin deacetylase (PgdA/CDA1 family)
VIAAAAFREQIVCLQTAGFQGLSVSQGLAGGSDARSVVITFDDGCETDLLEAAPVLHEAGFGATFYVVVGFLGGRGYLSVTQLRELGETGFEIGCHSMSHAYLSALSESQLHREIAGAKEELEQLLGIRVEHFSCPGGRWNRRVGQVAREAGYRSVVTSRIGMNSQTSDRFRLARVGVLKGTMTQDFLRLCHGQGLSRLRARQVALDLAKHVLGNTYYDKIRRLLLERA